MSKSSKRMSVRPGGGPAPSRPAARWQFPETARPRAEVKADNAGSGYSGTPLVRKLGVRPNECLVVLKAPDDYGALLPGLPEGVTIVNG